MYAPIWTGDEVIVPPASWWDPRPGFHGFEPGAIYVPRTNRWRELPTSPLNDASGPAVWTGRALVVVNSTTTDVPGILPGSSAAFDVQAGRWYRLQRPVNRFVGGEEQGVRTGRELLIPDATDLIRDGAQTFLLEQGGLRLGP